MVSIGWASRDRLGIILCLGTASLGSAGSGMSCSKHTRTLPVPLSWQGSGQGDCAGCGAGSFA